MKLKTKGIKPAVLADLFVSALSYAITAGLISIDPAVAALISKTLGSLAGVIAGPGEVVAADGTSARSRLADESGQYEPINLLVVVIVVIVLVVILLKVLDHV